MQNLTFQGFVFHTIKLNLHKFLNQINMNVVTLLGRLGKDPELKTSKADKSFALFSIATNDGYGDNKKTNWHNCICFGKTAELISQYVSKGDLLSVSGSIEYSEKDDKRYTNIVVNQFTFANSKDNNSSSSNDSDDDLPFD